LGQFWTPDADSYALAHVVSEQAARVYGDGPRRVQKGDIVLDCGAHVGVFVREALNARARIVVAVEPVPDKIACLRRNFAEEIRAGQVIVYPKGVWDKEDWLVIQILRRHSGGDSFVMTRDRSGRRLPLTSIDRLVEELSLPRVDFIKMDIEGAEQKALAGASKVIRSFHPRLALAVYHLSSDRSEIPKVVTGLWPGYRSECGACKLVGGRLLPEVLHFY
jgi:FkbM family methyltransferase